MYKLLAKHSGTAGIQVTELRAILMAGACLLGCTQWADAQVASQSASASQDVSGQAGTLNEIVVTATRRQEPISHVPMSVMAFSQDTLDQRGVRDVSQLLSLVPGVDFSQTGFGDQTAISIRGISSDIGQATTAIYINDTPVQVNNVGFASTNIYPQIFDLERVEVLRGPQGTLFGADSEGGAVRFITPSLDFNGSSGYVQSEVESTENGDFSYDTGAARGGVLVDGTLAYRASVYYVDDGGFIDRIPQPYPDAGPYQPENNSNWSRTTVLNGQLGWRPNDRLTITAGLFGQQAYVNDSSFYWVSTPAGQLSDPSKLQYINGNGVPESGNDNWVLPSLDIKYDMDWATLTSTTSYLTRYNPGNYDYRLFMTATFGGGSNPLPVFATPGYFSDGLIWNRQNNWTQEIRLASSNPDARLTWLTGVYLQSDVEQSSEILDTPFFNLEAGIPSLSSNDVSTLFFGYPLVDGKYVYIDYNRVRDNEYAVYGDATLRLFAGVKFSMGLRVDRSEVNFVDVRAAPGDGFGNTIGAEKQNPVTPRFSLSDQINNSNMVYATVAKGFRPGGVNRPLPVNPQCTADLESVGYSAAPTTYGSDNLWSYEVGSKNAGFGGRFSMDSSVYYIKWKGTQTDVGLPACGLDFIANVASATSKGFDWQLETRPFDGLDVVAAVGYTEATYDKTIQSAGSTTPIVRAGWTLGSPPWKFSLGAQYNFNGPTGAPSYLRADYTYQTKNNGLQAINDPTSAEYDPYDVINPAQQDLNMRLGWLIGGWNVSAFVNNLTDEHYELNVNNQALQGTILQATAVRPRTYGVTLQVHF